MKNFNTNLKVGFPPLWAPTEQKALLCKGEKILDQLSRIRFVTGFENPASFSLLRRSEEKGGIFKFRKKSCSILHLI